MPGEPRFCQVSLPVPLDRSFTYRLPETLVHRVQTGCRVLVPFGNRTLTGLVLSTCDTVAESTGTRDVLRLLDEEPVLDEQMLGLGEWIANYYCTPLGETLRATTPLAGEMRRGKLYALTSSGRETARQLTMEADSDPALKLLRALEARPLSASYLKQKTPQATAILKSLEKKGLVTTEEVSAERDPLRASAERLRVELTNTSAGKCSKSERELLAYLHLYPGSHNLAELELMVAKASVSARSLARRDLVKLTIEPVHISSGPIRARHALNPHQQDAYNAIEAALGENQFKAFLLQGVTGSGKTEVYLSAIDAALARGRGALLLVPEVGLTPAVAGQFHQRFAGKVATLHSAFHDAERAQEWRRIQSGDASVVVATRSGVFAPVRNLGLIIVDEEHDQSYKQQETPRYHGRDVAVKRAHDLEIPIVLGSATPSLESRYNAEQGKYTRLALPERIASRPMPAVTVIDMRHEFLETGKHGLFSRALITAIEERLDNGEQSMLLLNRRGFSAFAACRACGERVQCANCSVALTYHRRDRRMLCHYCSYSERVPEGCPKCGSEYLQFMGTGSERLEDELHGAFPKARIARLDRDTTARKRGYENILAGFRDGDYDILVGTQMIAKGHDIPNVTLAAILNADAGLGLPDFRAAERTFQLLTQAAGRAGRGETPGIVFMQTLAPDHYAVVCAAAQDYETFYQREIEFRRSMAYPPFSAMANIIVRAKVEEDALARSTALGRLLQPAPAGVKILGPAAAALSRLKDEFRYQMLVKARSRKLLKQVLTAVRDYAQQQQWNATALVIDVDPISVM